MIGLFLIILKLSLSAAVDVDYGSSISLNCNLAIPENNQVYWQKKTQQTNWYPIAFSNQKTFTKQSAVFEDSGSYRCQGYNIVRQFLIGPEQVIVVKGKAEVSVSNKVYAAPQGNVYLYCTVNINTNPSVNELWWERSSGGSGTRIHEDNKKYMGGYLSSPGLAIYKIQYSDAGEYRCYARNLYGDAYNASMLDVGERPTVETPIPKYYPQRGNTVNLECTVGNSHSVSWRKEVGGTLYPDSNSKYSGGTTANPSLTVTNVHEYDDGKYYCKGINNFGWNEAMTQIISGNPPTVTISNSPIYVVRGGNIVLDVTVHSNTAVNSVVWTKSSTTINPNVKYSIYNYDLTVTNVQASDDGYYTCTATNFYGSTSAVVQIISGYIPEITAPNYTARINTSIELKVTITAIYPAVYSVQWQKNGQNIQDWSRYTGGTTNKPSLTINTVGIYDDGTYRCTISNGVGTSYVEISLLTWDVPNVQLTGNNNIQIGTTAFISGSVTSKPAADRVVWKLETRSSTIDLPLSNTDKYELSGTATNPTLKIKNIQTNDAGKYFYIASNAYAAGSGYLEINVGEVTSVNIPLNHYVAIAGNQFTLDCLIKNSSDNRYVYWFKDSKYLTIYGRYSGGSLDNPSLIFKTVETADAGLYKCQLTTRFGTSEDTAELTVLSVSVASNPITKTANDTVTLDCTASGGLTLKWQRNGEYITTTDSDVYGGGTLDTPSLTITKLTRHDAGNYTCETSYNSVTAVSKLIHLVVQDIPLVETPRDVIKASSRSNVQLDCFYESNPSPTSVFWKKDGVQVIVNSTISKYNGSQVSHPALVIMNTDPTDSGIYQCVIENNKGKGYSSKIMLFISDPEASAASIEAVAGGIGAAVLLLIVVVIICVVVIIKRRRSNANKQPPSIRDANETVEYRTGGNRTDGLLYINIGRASNLQSSTDTDDDIPTKSLMIEEKTEDDNNTYYNVSHTITCIKVEDLKDYIKRKQINNSLEEEYKSVPYGAQHSTKTAQLKENIPKNRFKTTFPYDHSRVILQTVSGSSRSDYINANYVDGFEKEKCYIASQGPLKSTFSDFWRMIWENNIKKIVMLTGLVEGAKVKCDKYWPDGGKRMVVGNFVLTLISEKERAAYVTREISIEEKDKTKEKRFVLQYHFTAWPDHGTPDPLYLVLFHKHVTSDHARVESGPLLVHCSAGIGRTGTYIGLDALEEEGRTTGYIDVVKYVKKMRYARMNMVQTPEQYVCLHQALLEAFTMTDTNITKDRFSDVWKEIQSDKRPINHQRLHEEYKMLESKKSEHTKASYTVAASSTNTKKNRSNNVLPSDDARLYLVSFEKGRSDYINAVQVPSYTQFAGYITTQLPLEDTKTDFWTMIRDHNSSTIVLLLNEEREAGMVYEVTDDSYTRGPCKFKVSKREKSELDIHEISILMSKKDDRAKEICIYQAVCSSTPDAKVLCKLMNLIATRISMSHDPVTVVSSDGAKNCGLFCLFANAVQSMTIDDKVNIFQLARLLQLRRPEFFDDFNEYKMCYEALDFYLESANVYANF